MSGSRKVDIVELRALCCGLEALEGLGGDLCLDWTGARKLLSALACEDNNRMQVAKTAAGLARKLDASISTMHTLLLEMSSLSASLRSVSEPIIRRHYLLSLPTEIIAHIRVCLAELDIPEQPSSMGKKVSEPSSIPIASGRHAFARVCRGFRDVELSIPQLWTDIHDGMPIDHMRQVLSRSGDLGLKVHLNLTYNPFLVCQNCEKWKLLLQHKHRWSCLTINFYDSKVGHDCSLSLSNLHLPSLQGLHINQMHNGAREMVSAWTIPNIRSLTACDLSMLLVLPPSQPLSGLRLYHEYMQMRSDKLLHYLSSSTAEKLSSLEIVFNNPILGPEDAPQHPEVTLSLVEDLRLTSLGNRYNFTRALFPFLQRLKCPNVEVLSLRFTREVVLSDEFQAWVPSLLGPSLRCVTVVAIDDHCGATEQTLAQIFECRAGCSVETFSDKEKGGFSIKVSHKCALPGTERQYTDTFI